MKSKTFDKVLDAWYNVELNRVSEGQYGLGEHSRKMAIKKIEKRKKEYAEEFKQS